MVRRDARHKGKQQHGLEVGGPTTSNALATRFSSQAELFWVALPTCTKLGTDPDWIRGQPPQENNYTKRRLHGPDHNNKRLKYHYETSFYYLLQT